VYSPTYLVLGNRVHSTLIHPPLSPPRYASLLNCLPLPSTTTTGAATLSQTTLGITTLSLEAKLRHTQAIRLKQTAPFFNVVMPSVVMLSVVVLIVVAPHHPLSSAFILSQTLSHTHPKPHLSDSRRHTPRLAAKQH
jgi:hypothetical protein